jgi:hypothetical protein
MSQNEIDRCKNDPIYFFENYTNVKLTDFQKEMFEMLMRKEPVVIRLTGRRSRIPPYVYRWQKEILKALMENKNASSG